MRSFLIFMLLIVACWAQQDRPDVVHDIAGVWRSSTGATIEISPYEFAPGGKFSLLARLPGGGQKRFQATWQTGFRQQFVYRTADGDEIWGVVDRDGSTIALSNGKSFRAKWVR